MASTSDTTNDYIVATLGEISLCLTSSRGRREHRVPDGLSLQALTTIARAALLRKPPTMRLIETKEPNMLLRQKFHLSNHPSLQS